MNTVTVPPVTWGLQTLPPLDGATVVMTSPRALRAAHDIGLTLTACQVVHPGDARAPDPDGAEHVVALGGGTVVDAAKILASSTGLPLSVVPTVLSTDAPFSTVAAVRRGEVVEYQDTGAADQVIVYPALLDQAEWPLHLHGLADLLAVESATRDWQARRPDSAVGTRAATRALVTVALDHTDLWAAPSRRAWELLVELLRTKVALGLAAGYPWAEEGTEHYLAYLLEPHLRRPVWHGELLTAVLPVCAVLQEWDTRTVEAFRRFTTRLPDLHPTGADLLAPGRLRALLATLPGYCRRHHLDNTLLADDPIPGTVLDRATASWERGW